MKISKSLHAVAGKYKWIFFDSFGVLKDSQGVFDGTWDLIPQLEDRGIQSCLLTNDSSKSPEEHKVTFTSPAGKVLFQTDRIFSSGLLATDFLKNKVRRGKVAYLGTAASAWYIEEAGCDPVPAHQVKSGDKIVAFVFLDDEGFNWSESMNAVLNLLRGRNLPVINANADLSYPAGDKHINFAVGSIAHMVERVLGKHFIHFGKPGSLLYSYIWERILGSGSRMDKRHILMVGDTLTTDIIGGNRFGIDTALVLAGNTSPEEHRRLIETTGIIPDYVFSSPFS